MMLWFVLALMTAAGIVAVLWPLARRTPLSAGSDIAVYRDQLEEIERDRAAGLIGEREAEAAHVEVSRRLIAAADAVTLAPPPKALAWRRRAAALAALILLPVGAAGLYSQLGSPDLEGQMQAARRETPSEPRPMVEMVGRVEEHLAKNPEDGRGWEVLGMVYMRLARFDDAAKARRNSLRLLGQTAEREANLGEALTGAQNGIVSAEAKEAFDRAVRLDPNDVRSRYFIGLAAEQDGRPKDAATMWRALLAEAPADAAWAGFVRESLMRIDPASAAPRPPGPPGPSAEDITAANQMSPEQRNEMVRGMVSRLAERLKQDGSDVEGWLRLLRAYKVQGDKEQARVAADDARRALAGDPDKLRRLEEYVAQESVAGAGPAASAPPPSVAPAPPGPSAADIAAASEMSPEQQETMIRGMVARLAGRLKQDGSDVEGWLRLLRAYMVLGDRDQARAAAGEARRALASDPEKLRRVDDLIKGLGLEG